MPIAVWATAGWESCRITILAPMAGPWPVVAAEAVAVLPRAMAAAITSNRRLLLSRPTSITAAASIAVAMAIAIRKERF